MPVDPTIEIRNSEEIEEIITAVPHWILRWGVTVIFGILIIIILCSAFIQYPDIVKAGLKITSVNSPKTIISKQGGKLISLLVRDGESVQKDEILGIIESAANHQDVLELSSLLKSYRTQLMENSGDFDLRLPKSPNLGELQGSFQTVYQQYIEFQATQKNGYYLKQKVYLKQNLVEIEKLKKQILDQRKIQLQEYKNKEETFEAFKKLYDRKVISENEFKIEENKYLTGKYPLQESDRTLLNNKSSYNTKLKELADLEYLIEQQRIIFLQALNNLINQIEVWELNYVLRAPFDGKVFYAGIVQLNQNVSSNQELFVVSPGNTDFFGEMRIPQYNMGKVKVGQRTLIKMDSYPFEQFGMIEGKVTYISSVAYHDSVFLAKVSFESFENKKGRGAINLKNGMTAHAEIITEESSLLQRFLRNITKMLKTQ